MKRTLLAAVAMSVVLGLPAVAFTDQDVDLKREDLPDAVRETVDEQVGDGTIEDIDLLTAGGGELYEVEYEKDGKEQALAVASDGRVLVHVVIEEGQ